MNTKALKQLEALDDRDAGIASTFWDLVKSTNKDDPPSEDVRALREMLAEYPFLWRIGGDMARLAADTLIREMQATPFLKESLEAGWDALADELGYGTAPALERLLIEQVILCWMRLNLAEYYYTDVSKSTRDIVTLNFLDRKLSASQRRYLRACETLARVRKIIRRTPALQINIATQGGQQVNVASTA